MLPCLWTCLAGCAAVWLVVWYRCVVPCICVPLLLTNSVMCLTLLVALRWCDVVAHHCACMVLFVCFLVAWMGWVGAAIAVIHQGVPTFLDKNPAWRARFFVLDNGVLRYYASQQAFETGAKPIKNNQLAMRNYRLQLDGTDDRAFKLESVTVRGCEEA